MKSKYQEAFNVLSEFNAQLLKSMSYVINLKRIREAEVIILELIDEKIATETRMNNCKHHRTVARRNGSYWKFNYCPKCGKHLRTGNKNVWK